MCVLTLFTDPIGLINTNQLLVGVVSDWSIKLQSASAGGRSKMLGSLCRLLGERKIILASGSPRRKQILENIVCMHTLLFWA